MKLSQEQMAKLSNTDCCSRCRTTNVTLIKYANGKLCCACECELNRVISEAVKKFWIEVGLNAFNA